MHLPSKTCHNQRVAVLVAQASMSWTCGSWYSSTSDTIGSLRLLCRVPLVPSADTTFTSFSPEKSDTEPTAPRWLQENTRVRIFKAHSQFSQKSLKVHLRTGGQASFCFTPAIALRCSGSAKGHLHTTASSTPRRVVITTVACKAHVTIKARSCFLEDGTVTTIRPSFLAMQPLSGCSQFCKSSNQERSFRSRAT